MTDISIKILNGDKILSNLILGKLVFLRDRETVLDLIVFDEPYFDIMLGMDFLHSYRVESDYKKKESLVLAK